MSVINTPQAIAQTTLRQILRFRVALFLLLLLLVYGFIIWRADSLSKAQPDQTSITAQSSPNIRPTINQTLISKVKQLQDNSVSVQALFNQARQNPFQE